MCGIVTQFSMRFPYVAAVVRESGATTLLLQPLSGDAANPSGSSRNCAGCCPEPARNRQVRPRGSTVCMARDQRSCVVDQVPTALTRLVVTRFWRAPTAAIAAGPSRSDPGPDRHFGFSGFTFDRFHQGAHALFGRDLKG